MTGRAIKGDGGADHVDEAVPHDGLKDGARWAYERARSNGPAEGDGKPPDPKLVAALDSALMRLSQLERDVFLAMRVDNLSIAEIAERIGISDEKARRIFVSAFGNLERNMANPRRRWWRLWIP